MKERLLELFERHPGEFLSGEQLSGELGCSRTAVWKRIRALKEQGYTFEAAPRKGYRLMDKPERIDVQSLAGKLQGLTLGQSIKLFDEVSSTQDIAHQLVKEGAQEGTLVLAEAQTSGRGRMGRRWHSPKGKGIWMSLVLKPHIPLQLTPQLTLLTAVALCRAIRKAVPVEAGIKWPNDLLAGGRKIAGILLESSAEDERLNYIIVGVGISANLRERDFPEELRSVATSLLAESGQTVDRELLIALFLRQLEELYGLYQREGFSPIRSLWEALNVTVGKRISVRTPAGQVEGTANGIDDSGALLLVDDKTGAQTRIYSGDLSG